MPSPFRQLAISVAVFASSPLWAVDPKPTLDLCHGTLAAAGEVAVVEKSLYASLPPDVAPRMRRAIEEGMLDIGSWGHTAITLLETMGLPREEIARVVGAKLEKYLGYGRDHGLSSVPPALGVAMLTGGVRPALPGPEARPLLVVEGHDVPKKYDLAKYKELVDRMGRVDRWSLSNTHYSIGIGDAMAMALRIGRTDLAAEALVHMVRLNSFDHAIGIAEQMGSDEGLWSLGMLALVNFYEGEGRHRYHTNHLWNAIEAFKRIRGPLKQKANDILYDLAMQITSPEFVRRAAEYQGAEEGEVLANNLEYALRCLRQAGTVIAREAIDSVKTHYFTRIDDPRVVQAIQSLADRVIGNKRYDRDTVRHALEAIGDTKRLNALGDAALARVANTEPDRQHYAFEDALQHYEAAKNTAKVREVLGRMLAALDSDDDVFTSHRATYTILPALFRAGDRDGIRRLQAIARGRLGGRDHDWKKLLESIDGALAGNEPPVIHPRMPADLPANPYALHGPTAEEPHLREALEKAKNKPVAPAELARLRRQADELLAAGRGWEAYQIFLELRDREGLLRAGDEMVRRGDGLNATRPYLAAAMLPPTALPPGAAPALPPPAK